MSKFNIVHDRTQVADHPTPLRPEDVHFGVPAVWQVHQVNNGAEMFKGIVSPEVVEDAPAMLEPRHKRTCPNGRLRKIIQRQPQLIRAMGCDRLPEGVRELLIQRLNCKGQLADLSSGYVWLGAHIVESHATSLSSVKQLASDTAYAKSRFQAGIVLMVGKWGTFIFSASLRLGISCFATRVAVDWTSSAPGSS